MGRTVRRGVARAVGITAALLLGCAQHGDGSDAGESPEAGESDAGLDPGSCAGGTEHRYELELRIAPVSSMDVSRGFDLDGRVSDATDEASCGHADFVSPDGRPGIDNQLWVLDARTRLAEGDPPTSEAELRLTGVESFTGDGCVTVRISSPEPVGEGTIDEAMDDARIVDGELEARGGVVAFPGVVLRDVRLRAPVSPERVGDGVLGGAISVDEAVAAASELAPEVSSDRVREIYEAESDLDRAGGVCQRLSAALTLSGPAVESR